MKGGICCKGGSRWYLIGRYVVCRSKGCVQHGRGWLFSSCGTQQEEMEEVVERERRGEEADMCV